jgi:hypothetical protein
VQEKLSTACRTISRINRFKNSGLRKTISVAHSIFHLPGQPLAPVDADLDVKREPGLYAGI